MSVVSVSPEMLGCTFFLKNIGRYLSTILDYISYQTTVISVPTSVRTSDIIHYVHIVTCRCISDAREQIGKHVPAKKNSWPTKGKGISIARQRAVNKFRQQ
jgi:hypothetical protein